VTEPEPAFKTKKCGKESTLFNSIHKHSFGGLGADTLYASRLPFLESWGVYPPLVRSNYFQKESTLFERSVPLFMNIALYPRKELTVWVDSQKGRLGRYYYYGNFSHNYFEYLLRGFDFRPGIPKERQWQWEKLETERTSSGTSWMDEMNFQWISKMLERKTKDIFMTPSHFKTLKSKNKYRLIRIQ
jgi:hypothetical protein